MELTYDFEIVGGPHDGAPSMAWIDDGDRPPPSVIFVGECGVGVGCGSRRCRCDLPHTSYWVSGEERPTGCVAYEKGEEYVKRTGPEELVGIAVYVLGGLRDPRSFGERAREPLAA